MDTFDEKQHPSEPGVPFPPDSPPDRTTHPAPHIIPPYRPRINPQVITAIFVVGMAAFHNLYFTSDEFRYQVHYYARFIPYGIRYAIWSLKNG